MGFLDKVLDKMNFGDNDDDEQIYDDYGSIDDDDDDEVPSTRVKKKKEDIYKETESEETRKETSRQPASRPAKPVKQRATSPKPVSNNSKVVRMGHLSSLEVCVIKPTNVEDGREIANTLLGGKAVVLNLEGIDVELAQRIIDFTSGACFAINGNLQKVSNYIFIITPESVDISGDFQGYISNDGSFAQDLRF